MFTGSKKELLDLIKRKGTLSVDEAVEHTGLAKTTLREHLLQLERDGYIERDYVRTGPGRPRLEYKMTAKGDALYPSFESKLFKELVKYLKRHGNENIIEDFFRVFWEERLDEVKRKMHKGSSTDIKARLHILQQMLEEEGFMPEFSVDKTESELTVKECNCPFSEVVKETQLPCKLEAIFYEKLFDKKAERTTYIAEGDYSCTYKVPL